MEDRSNEDSCLAHSTLSLTKDVISIDSLRDGFLLDFRRMFKACFLNRPLEFWFKHEVFEASGVVASIASSEKKDRYYDDDD
jgi:hypothetical protein